MGASHCEALVCFVLWINGNYNKLLSKLVPFENEKNTFNNYFGTLGINQAFNPTSYYQSTDLFIGN